MCLNSKKITKEGKYKESNYRGSKGQYYNIIAYSKCGSCEQCIAEKSNNWVVRNHYESKAHTRKCFITLTYRNNPYIIVRKDLQDFMKRLRWQISTTTQEKIRIFYCSEYGSRGNRPHHHIIIYGWDDPKAEYLTISGRKQIVYQSKIIQKAWGLGRTSYQTFNDNEVPYIALYNTPQEEFKKAYKMTREKAKKLKSLAEFNPKMDERQKRNMIDEIEYYESMIEEEKKNYILVKEKQGWSLALGWEKFSEEYFKAPNYAFVEYVHGGEFVTPTPWLKKLANKYGDIAAAEEIFRREEQIKQSKTEDEERKKNFIEIAHKRIKERQEWVDDRKTGVISNI